MRGDTIAYDYRAVTDRLAKRWHLGAVQTTTRAFCGTDLYNRTDKDGFEAVTDLARVDCGACRRMGRYKVDVLGQVEAPVPAPRRGGRGGTPNANPAAIPAATGAGLTEAQAAEMAAAAAERAADTNGKPSTRKGKAKPAAGSGHEGDGGRQAPTTPGGRPRRQSRASRSAELAAAAKQERDETLAALEARIASELGEAGPDVAAPAAAAPKPRRESAAAKRKREMAELLQAEREAAAALNARRLAGETLTVDEANQLAPHIAWLEAPMGTDPGAGAEPTA